MAEPFTNLGPASGFALYYLLNEKKEKGVYRRLSLSEIRQEMRERYVKGTFTQAMVNTALRMAQQNALASERQRELAADDKLSLVFGAHVPGNEGIGVRVRVPVKYPAGDASYVSVTVNVRADATTKQVLDAARAEINSGRLYARVHGSPVGTTVDDVDGVKIDGKDAQEARIFIVQRQMFNDPSVDMR